jgi:hypothetical protein
MVLALFGEVGRSALARAVSNPLTSRFSPTRTPASPVNIGTAVLLIVRASDATLSIIAIIAGDTKCNLTTLAQVSEMEGLYFPWQKWCSGISALNDSIHPEWRAIPFVEPEREGRPVTDMRRI